MTLSDKKILNKVIDGDSSKEDAQCAANWFSSTIEGQQTLSDMMDRDAYLIEEEISRNNPISVIQSRLLFKKIEKDIRRKETRQLLFRSAAILVPFVMILGLGIYMNKQLDLFGKTTYAEIHIPKGEKARILFQDGSEAFLNSDTKIRYPRKFGISKRTVRLQGEAYFNIAHNKYRPFIVETKNGSIKVLGTSFNVSAYGEEETISVTLDEGSVVFNSEHNRYRLQPGQQIIYNKLSEDYAIRNLDNSLVNSLWTTNMIHFQDTPLEEVIRTLERRFNAEFSILDSGTLDYSFTITTGEQSLGKLLGELEKIAPVKFTFRNNIYEVSSASRFQKNKFS